MHSLRTLGRTGGASALAAALATGLISAMLSGPGMPVVPAAPPGTAITPVAADAGLAGFDSCHALLAWYVAGGLREVGPYGWADGPMVRAYDDLAGQRVPAAAPTEPALGSSPTGTNTQQAGVDEPDIAKTDGRLLVRVDGDTVRFSDVSGAQPRTLTSYRLPRGMYDAELLLVGDRLVVTSQQGGIRSGPIPYVGAGPAAATFRPSDPIGARVLELDVADPAHPVKVSDEVFSGTSVSVRQYGDVVRLVTSTPAPNLAFRYPGNRGSSPRQALVHNRAVVQESTLADWLPTVREVGSGVPAQQLVPCQEVLHPREHAGPGTLAVVGFDAKSPEVRSSVAITAAGDTVYSSTDRIYVAAAGSSGRLMHPLGALRLPRPAPGTTDVHGFDLHGTSATYTASGTVKGVLRDRWSMDEYDGHLRLALQTGSTQTINDGAERAGANAVVVLTREGDRLVETGRLNGLGQGEEIKSVRWFDDLAVVVTFRELDPLHTVDLSDPAHPRLLGELTLPGFSGYLHPIGHNLLLGIGTAADQKGRVQGALLSVFDLSDRSHPEQVDRRVLDPESYLSAPNDPRSFTWLPGAGVGWTELSSWSGADRGGRSWLVRIAVDDQGRMTARKIGVPGLTPNLPTRVLPLPDGRVVVVSGAVARTLYD